MCNAQDVRRRLIRCQRLQRRLPSTPSHGNALAQRGDHREGKQDVGQSTISFAAIVRGIVVSSIDDQLNSMTAKIVIAKYTSQTNRKKELWARRFDGPLVRTVDSRRASGLGRRSAGWRRSNGRRATRRSRSRQKGRALPLHFGWVVSVVLT